MLVLDLEPELVFLDKLTQDLVLAVRYVCTLIIITKKTQPKTKANGLECCSWVSTSMEVALSQELRCLRHKNSVGLCKGFNISMYNRTTVAEIIFF